MRKHDEELGAVLRGAQVPPPGEAFMETLLARLDDSEAAPSDAAATDAAAARPAEGGGVTRLRRRRWLVPAGIAAAAAAAAAVTVALLPGTGPVTPGAQGRLTLTQVLQKLGSPDSSVSAISGRIVVGAVGGEGKSVHGTFVLRRDGSVTMAVARRGRDKVSSYSASQAAESATRVTNSLLSASVTRPAGTQKPRPARTGAPAGARLGDVPPPVFGAAAIRAFIKTGDQGWSVSEGSFGDRHVWIARRDVPAAEESAFSKGAGTEVHGPLTVECRIDEATGLVVRWALLSGDTVVWQVRLDDLQVNPTAWPTELPTSLPTDAPASTTGAAGAGQ